MRLTSYQSDSLLLDIYLFITVFILRQNSKRVDTVPAGRQQRASLPESQQITTSTSGYQQEYHAIRDNRPPPYASVSN